MTAFNSYEDYKKFNDLNDDDRSELHKKFQPNEFYFYAFTQDGETSVSITPKVQFLAQGCCDDQSLEIEHLFPETLDQGELMEATYGSSHTPDVVIKDMLKAGFLWNKTFVNLIRGNMDAEEETEEVYPTFEKYEKAAKKLKVLDTSEINLVEEYKNKEVNLTSDEQEFLDQTDDKETESKLSADEKEFLNSVSKPEEPVKVYTEEDKKAYVLPENMVAKDFYYSVLEDPGYGRVEVFLVPKDYFDKFGDYYLGEMDVDSYLPKGVAGNEGEKSYIRESPATTSTTIRAMQLCAFNWSEKFTAFTMNRDGCEAHCACSKHFEDVEQEMEQEITDDLKETFAEAISDYCLNHKDELNKLATNVAKVNKSVLTKKITKKDNWEFSYRQRVVGAEFYGMSGEIIEYGYKSKAAKDEFIYAGFVYTNPQNEIQKVKIVIEAG